eukprot:s3390_g7.t1
MPLSMFKEKQTIVAMLVAKHDEPAWGVPTLCCRLLAQDGSQLELQSTGEARQHFDQFPLHVVCSFEVARACVKAYGATSKTGIKNKAFVRMAVPSACGLLLRSCPCLCESVFQRALASFPLEVVADREHAQLQDIDQMAEATCDSMTNVCGKVVRIGPPPPSSEGGALARRTIGLRYGDYEYDACATNARLVAVDDSIFDCNIWVSDQKLRVPITLRDLSGSVEATLWGEQLLLDQRLSLTQATGVNVDEMATVWGLCEDDGEARQTFLDIFKPLTTSERTWMLRPKPWKDTIQWNVAAISAPLASDD